MAGKAHGAGQDLALAQRRTAAAAVVQAWPKRMPAGGADKVPVHRQTLAALLNPGVGPESLHGLPNLSRTCCRGQRFAEVDLDRVRRLDGRPAEEHASFQVKE